MDGTLVPLAASGASTNAHGRVYYPGKSYGVETKLQVAELYEKLKAEQGSPPTGRALATAADVSLSFAQKIVKELKDHGRVLAPSEIEVERPRGVGIFALDHDDECFLLWLRSQNPLRTNRSYVAELFVHRGVLVSETFISEWFKKRWPHDASFRHTSQVPIDKFKPLNIERYDEYVRYMVSISMRRIKFGDEKSLKGEEIFSRKVRPCPLTGVAEGVVVESDFRNTYCIMGFCSADPTQEPFKYTMGKENHDSYSFTTLISLLIGAGWIRRGDILVVDRSQVHMGGDAADLVDELWNFPSPFDGMPMLVLLKFLPARSPELNPIEELWNTLVQCLKQRVALGGAAGVPDFSFNAAKDVMDSFEHKLVYDTYVHCGYNYDP